MVLKTSRFGEIEYTDDQVVTFTQPIIGFPEHRRFILLTGPQEGITFWLQSTEDGDLAFVLMNPKSVVPDYSVSLGAHELTELGVDSADSLDIYSLVVVSSNPEDIRTNLKAPVLINPATRLGKQTILDKSDYPIRYYIKRREGRPSSSEEAIDARSNA